MTVNIDEIFSSEGKRGRRGISIVDVTISDAFELLITLSNGFVINAGTLPPGKDGIGGSKGDPGKDGKDGKDGRDGIDGKDGRDGVDGRDGKDGASGKDGKDGIDGVDGAPGLDGEDGKDGVSVERIRISDEGELLVLLSDGEELNAGKLPKSSQVTFKNGETVYEVMPWGQNVGDIAVYNGSKFDILPAPSSAGLVLESSPDDTLGVRWATDDGSGLHDLTDESGNYLEDESGNTLQGTDEAVLAVDEGGTGQTSYTDGQLLVGNSTGNTLDKATLTEGEAIDVTNGGGSITIACEDASTTNKGVAELATDAETNTGTDTGRVLTPSNLAAWTGSTVVTTLGTIATGTWQATTVDVGYGGTGQTSYTDGQLLIGNSTGNTLAKATLTEGEAIDITNGNGTITIACEDASTTNKGVVELATDGETNTGTDTTRAITPSNLEAWTGSTTITSLGTISVGTWQGTTIAVDQGGTGETSYIDGQILIGNSTGNTLAKATITEGEAIDITNGSGSITIACEDATTTNKGVSELATDAETNTGTDTTRTITPSNLTAWTGSTNIATLGTITSGTWQGTVIGVAYGGTGTTSYTDGQLLIGNSSGSTLTVATLTEGEGIDITNGSGSITVSGEDASTTNKGIVELATDSETNTGTDTARAITPSNLEAWTGSTNIASLGTITVGTWNGIAIGVAYGGTGLSSYTIGDLIYADGATSLAKLTAVAGPKVLTTGGAATAPSWDYAEGSTTLSKSANYTILSTDANWIRTTGSSSFTLTLPTAVGIEGKIYNIKHVGSGTITVDGNASETIDGATTVSILAGVVGNYPSLKLRSNNVGWDIV